MKKIVFVLSSYVLLLIFTGCGNKVEPIPEPNKPYVQETPIISANAYYFYNQQWYDIEPTANVPKGKEWILKANKIDFRKMKGTDYIKITSVSKWCESEQTSRKNAELMMQENLVSNFTQQIKIKVNKAVTEMGQAGKISEAEITNILSKGEAFGLIPIFVDEYFYVPVKEIDKGIEKRWAMTYLLASAKVMDIENAKNIALQEMMNFIENNYDNNDSEVMDRVKESIEEMKNIDMDKW